MQHLRDARLAWAEQIQDIRVLLAALRAAYQNDPANWDVLRHPADHSTCEQLLAEIHPLIKLEVRSGRANEKESQDSADALEAEEWYKLLSRGAEG